MHARPPHSAHQPRRSSDPTQERCNAGAERTPRSACHRTEAGLGSPQLSAELGEDRILLAHLLYLSPRVR